MQAPFVGYLNYFLKFPFQLNHLSLFLTFKRGIIDDFCLPLADKNKQKKNQNKTVNPSALLSALFCLPLADKNKKAKNNS